MNQWIKMHSVIADLSNQRIKVMNGSVDSDPHFLIRLSHMENRVKSTKTIIYARKNNVPYFLANDFNLEGKIDGFFNGQNGYLLTRYQSQERASSKSPREAEDILLIAQKDQKRAVKKGLPNGFILRRATESDAPELSSLFHLVFPNYPTPVYDPEYLKTVMAQTLFMAMEHKGQLVSVSSAEVTQSQSCAELTDCATHPHYRGQNLLSFLFFSLEEKMREMGICYLFTLTRALSASMNLTAARHGYVYRGRLINNCIIYSGFEDMNIWVKPLKPTWD
jgi:beta-lysine N6-acetyltransferase